MEFQLIDKELCEANLYYKAHRLSHFSASEIADLYYMCMMGLLMIYLNDRDSAKEYLRRTTQFGTYALFRTHATDMYMLAYHILHPDNDHLTMSDPVTGKKYLNSLQFDGKANIRMLIMMLSGNIDSDRLYVYLYRLERQLKISKSRYKQWRREIFQWNSLDNKEKTDLIKRLMFEFKMLGNNGGTRSDIAEKLRELS